MIWPELSHNRPYQAPLRFDPNCFATSGKAGPLFDIASQHLSKSKDAPKEIRDEDKMNVEFKKAELKDIKILGVMNKRLIEDEGHSNPMNIDELTERMRNFIVNE